MEKPILKLSGTIYWAFLDRTNDLSGKYMFDLGNLSDAAVKALEDAGVDVKHKDTQGYYIVYKSKYPIEIYDKNGTELDNSGVGNGSKAIVVTSFYETQFKKKSWVQPSPKKVVITEMVRYFPGVGDDADIEDDSDVL